MGTGISIVEDSLVEEPTALTQFLYLSNHVDLQTLPQYSRWDIIIL